MMISDEKIEQALAEQSKELDALMQSDNSLQGYLKLSFASGLGWIVKLGYCLAIALSVLMFYCGYQFFTATAQTETFWGVCLIISFQAQVATKLRIFMQANRNYLSRELRLLQLRKDFQP